MLNGLRTIAHLFNQKIGLSRLGVALSVTIIVIAAFVPAHLRMSIFTTVTHRLGITGASLATVKQAFASADDIRRATGLLGLVLAVFYVSSFTTALRRGS